MSREYNPGCPAWSSETCLSAWILDKRYWFVSEIVDMTLNSLRMRVTRWIGNETLFMSNDLLHMRTTKRDWALPYYVILIMAASKKSLSGGESNPALPRDRRVYYPIYYQRHSTVFHETF